MLSSVFLYSASSMCLKPECLCQSIIVLMSEVRYVGIFEAYLVKKCLHIANWHDNLREIG